MGVLGEIGARLRGERERLGFTQEGFGKIAGVTRNTQLAYEAGKRACDAAYVAALTSSGVDVAYMFTGKRAEGALDPDEAALIACFRALDSEAQSAVLRMVQVMAAGRSPEPTVHSPRDNFRVGRVEKNHGSER